MARMETEDSSESIVPEKRLRGHLTHSLWVGRRKHKRQIMAKFKECAWIDIENQITAQLLAEAEKLPTAIEFEMTFEPKGNVHCAFSDEKRGQDFYRHLQQNAHHFQ